jgi:hypothetical protein
MEKSYKPSKRSWVKLWVDEWLAGTTRFELSERQRAIWIDLIAMAGKSRFPGIVASGRYDDGFRGYPISYLAGSLVYTENDFREALNTCAKYGKIKMETKNHDGTENVVIFINNWEKYQSEYLRQRKYDEDETKNNGAGAEKINSQQSTEFIGENLQLPIGCEDNQPIKVISGNQQLSAGCEDYQQDAKIISRNKDNNKKEFFQSVHLTTIEHDKLIERFGEKKAVDKIEALALYKSSKGKKYASDYSTILNWDRREQKEKEEPITPKKRHEPGVPDSYNQQLDAHLKKVKERQE